MNSLERDVLLAVWSQEHERTMSVVESLPEGQYDVRPDPDNRSRCDSRWGRSGHALRTPPALEVELLTFASEPTEEPAKDLLRSIPPKSADTPMRMK